MTRLDSKPLSLTSPAASQIDDGSAHRLIVLFPASESENPNVLGRIWEIASSSRLEVLLLSLCSNYNEEAQIRRKLVTMAAIFKASNVCTDIRIEHGSDWIRKVKDICQPGDILACYAGQKVGLMRQSLDQALRSNLEAPLYILSEDQPIKGLESNLVLRTSGWFGSLAIIASFLWAEIKIIQLPQDWAHTSLLYLCVFVEVALIWAWNSIST